MEPGTPDADSAHTMTLEAFADTIIPGEKRWPVDPAIAGVAAGGGAVTAGAVELLRLPAVGLAEMLDFLMDELNGHARRYVAEHGLVPDPSLPPFVGLSYPDRSALIHALTSPGHPEKEFWVGLALFANMAFDSAPHLPTAQAIASEHPGLLAMGFAPPDSDGRWRFPQYSYGRALADLHPQTTATGSPA